MADSLSIEHKPFTVDELRCHFEGAAQIIGQKWMLQIVYILLQVESIRFCSLQEALGGVNPSTLSSRLKMLEEEEIVHRIQVSTIPPHVEYRLTEKGRELDCVVKAITTWSATWLCGPVHPYPLEGLRWTG